MVFDLELWNSLAIKNKALKLISELKEKAIFWDQDILNVIFDEYFIELPEKLNSRTRDHKTDEPVIFHHFSGKYKPWSIRGIEQKYSYKFHETYQRIYKKKYLIVVPNVKNALKQLKVELDNKRILIDKKGLVFLYYIFFGIIKKIFRP